jgi:glycosyltransferase involved in cell wall biosynthesis
MKGAIIVPAFNEEQNIAEVVARIQSCQYIEDIIVINDGSTDNTLSVLQNLQIKHINHPINLGYVRALQTGLRFAKENQYDYVIFIDGDGQHDPRQISNLKEIGFSENGPDIVIGSRFVKDKKYIAPLGRRLGMMLFSWLTGFFAGSRIYDTTSGFKLIKRNAFSLVVDQIFGDFHAEMIIFSLIIGLKIKETPIIVAERKFGTSMYSWLSALAYPFKTMIAIAVLWPEARRLRRTLS